MPLKVCGVRLNGHLEAKVDKEYMNEICCRGKGSRGGKGSRKRRNGGKASTRQLSADESKRAEDRLEAFEKSVAGRYREGDLKRRRKS
jgi:hypothetical protein